MPRIVSLLPSATEIVAALGFEADLVGRSHECDFPESVLSLPVLTKPSFPADGSSREIDEEVRGLVEKGLSLYRVDAPGLKALRPDLIVTQTQCEVCAVSEGELVHALGEWVGGHPQVLSLQALSLAGLWEDIQRVAAALGAPDRGGDLVSTLQKRIVGIRERAERADTRPRVLCLEWLDPPMASGNWIPELILAAGGEPVLGEVGVHSPVISVEQIREADPDIVLLIPCGFDIPRTRREFPILKGNPSWRDLKSVQNQQVYLADGNQFFNRPGPRLVESAEILAEILHSRHFSFGHSGRAWEQAGA